MTHTQGPWENVGGYVEALDLDTPLSICTIADCGTETEANARLIAAAPDLLEALQEAVNKGYMWDHDPDLWSKASAAIAKAKGN